MTHPARNAVIRCIFCGDDDLTEEHLIADWVFRAFVRSKKGRNHFSGTFVGPHEMRLSTDDPISTVKVVCQRCNNEVASEVTNSA